MNYLIYCIRNIINDKVYIGQTSDFEKRKKEHIKKLNINLHHNKHLQYSWNKYGGDNFVFEILKDNIDIKEINDIEKLYILLFQTNNSDFGYNLTEGGDGVKGYKHSEEIIENMKRTRKNRIGYFKDKKHTQEAKNNIREYAIENNNMKNKNHTEETKKKISLKMKETSKERRKNNFVLQEQINNVKNLLKKGLTQMEISKILGIPQPKISLIKNNKY
ncbi:MAG: GIY-YIG nuclease family protein [Bacilli bacterium]|nr:GIY-YIG nuclease family protein [Bacilli bacterium]